MHLQYVLTIEGLHAKNTVVLNYKAVAGLTFVRLTFQWNPMGKCTKLVTVLHQIREILS